MTVRATAKNWLYGKVPGWAGSFPYFRTRVYFPKNSCIFKMACEQGVYEINTLRVLQSLLRPETHYFDVGANIGLLSVPILVDQPNCTVVSFEASPTTAAYLQRTATESRFAFRWHVVPKAVGETVGDVTFHCHNPALGAYDSLANTARVSGPMEVIRVPMTTIDAVWTALGEPCISVIKIDVEGAEMKVLKGAANCLKQTRPSVLLEWNAANLVAHQQPATALLDFALANRYQVFEIQAMVPITDECTLRVHMTRGENFLLVPLGTVA